MKSSVMWMKLSVIQGNLFSVGWKRAFRVICVSLIPGSNSPQSRDFYESKHPRGTNNNMADADSLVEQYTKRAKAAVRWLSSFQYPLVVSLSALCFPPLGGWNRQFEEENRSASTADWVCCFRDWKWKRGLPGNGKTGHRKRQTEISSRDTKTGKMTFCYHLHLMQYRTCLSLKLLSPQKSPQPSPTLPSPPPPLPHWTRISDNAHPHRQAVTEY